jgi:hypothetical protein
MQTIMMNTEEINKQTNREYPDNASNHDEHCNRPPQYRFRRQVPCVCVIVCVCAMHILASETSLEIGTLRVHTQARTGTIWAGQSTFAYHRACRYKCIIEESGFRV